MWRCAIHCHAHGMHVWSHDPLCCADAEPTRGKGCASRSLQSLNYCERKKKGLRAVWTPQGFQLKSEHVTTTASQSNNIAYDSNVSLPSSERIRNLVPRLFHLPAPWRIRRSPDGRLALETFCALRGNFSVDPMLITTPTRRQLSFAKAQPNTNLSTEQLWIQFRHVFAEWGL